MRQRFVGRSGLRVSRIGLGTMTWGRDTDEYEAREQLTAFVDAGGTLLDTAASYGGGASEELIGAMIGDVVRREEIVLATKAGVYQQEGGWTTDLSRARLLSTLDQSLRRLGTDHVDLWQVHTWAPGFPLDETLSAVDFAVASGRARYAGISNYCGWQTAKAAGRQQAWPGRAPLVSVQVEYSLLERGIEREVVAAADDFGLGILAWAPLAAGVLTGKYRSGTPSDSRGAVAELSRDVSAHLDERGRGIIDAVCKAADGLGLAPAEVSLAWVRDRPGVAAPIVGARTAGQLRASLTVEDVELPDEIVAALDDVSAITVGYPEQLR
jgi:aryl-alcohol dehydrogenase-like predicted oxidoreductase